MDSRSGDRVSHGAPPDGGRGLRARRRVHRRPQMMRPSAYSDGAVIYKRIERGEWLRNEKTYSFLKPSCWTLAMLGYVAKSGNKESCERFERGLERQSISPKFTN